MVSRALAVIYKPAVVPFKVKKNNYRGLILILGVLAALVIGFFAVKGLKFFPFSIVAVSSNSVYDILLAFTAVDFLYFLARYEGFLSFLSLIDTVEGLFTPVASTLVNVTNTASFADTFGYVVNREVFVIYTAFSSLFYLIFSFFGGFFDFIFSILKYLGGVIAEPTFAKFATFFDKYIYNYIRWLNPLNWYRIWGFRAFLEGQLVSFLPFVNSFIQVYLESVLQPFTYLLEVGHYFYSAKLIPSFYWFVTIFFPFFWGLEAFFLFLLKFKGVSFDVSAFTISTFQSILLPFFLLYCFFLTSLISIGFLVYTLIVAYCPLFFFIFHSTFSTILNFFNTVQTGLSSGLWYFYNSHLYFGFSLLFFTVVCFLLCAVFLGVFLLTLLRICFTLLLACSLALGAFKVFFTYVRLTIILWLRLIRLSLVTILIRANFLLLALCRGGFQLFTSSFKTDSNLVSLFDTVFSSVRGCFLYLKLYSLLLLGSVLAQLANPLPFIKLFWDGLSFYIMSFSPSLLFLQDLLEVNPDQEDGVLEWPWDVDLQEVAIGIAKSPPFSVKSAIAAKFEYFNYALWLVDSYKLFFLWFLVVAFLVLLAYRYLQFDINLALGCVGIVLLFNLITTYGLTLFYTTVCNLFLLYRKHNSIMATDVEGFPYYLTLSSFIFYTMEMEAIDDIYDVTPWLQDDICDVYEEYTRKKKFVRFMVPVWRFLIEESGGIK